MRAECKPMRFARLKGRDVVADFGGGAMTSDAGALLLGATDRAIGLVACLRGVFWTVARRGAWCTTWRCWAGWSRVAGIVRLWPASRR